MNANLKMKTHFITRILSYRPDNCYHCNHPVDCKIVFNGFKTSTIKLPPLVGGNVYLKLKKIRILCKHCGRTFTLETSLVSKHCNISHNTKIKILINAKDKISEKQIAINNNVSTSTVSKLIFSRYSEHKVDYKCLSETLCFDEFKSTKDAKGSISFIYMDYKKSKIIDIVEDRRIYNLKNHFSRYTKKARNSVKYIVIDMYKPYISLIKEMFKNAKIIIDRFHIVQLFSRALNKTRIKVMNENKDYYNRLKRYYKLLLKPYKKIKSSNYKRCYCYKKFMSEQDILADLLSSSDILKNTYEIYQELLYSVQNKDVVLFENTLNNNNDNNKLSPYMNTSIKTLTKYKDYIVNALTNTASNGRFEAINNTIKVVKRIAFGFRNFCHF